MRRTELGWDRSSLSSDASFNMISQETDLSDSGGRRGEGEAKQANDDDDGASLILSFSFRVLFSILLPFFSLLSPPSPSAVAA